ncbi:hypothetical protein GF108_12590 [Phyllobacterium sp. SYP-B3895]|uniref:hypothetical protein n=1 Tax=Phyllobacterium sp. SYP-B3895 TaxID=2663240 RepID=UPI00129A0935|nr:hypothetical protein [Phyllobacterium sp. SYP-B3895]MRG56414.1 hypothetical protein [Phyllobacterium sp. SYP-B3895]
MAINRQRRAVGENRASRPSTKKRAIYDITWQPIHFDKRNRPDEFVGVAFRLAIGRVYRLYGGPLHGRWYYNFQLGHSPFRASTMNGVVSSRKAAQKQVLQTFKAFLATPSVLGGGKAG